MLQAGSGRDCLRLGNRHPDPCCPKCYATARLAGRVHRRIELVGIKESGAPSAAFQRTSELGRALNPVRGRVSPDRHRSAVVASNRLL